MIQYSTNGGSNWTTAATIVPIAGNGVWVHDVIQISAAFTDTTQFRIQHSANGTSDYTYFDDVVITACEGGGCTREDTHGFENVWGIWNDGGTYAALSTAAEYLGRY
jgi:hypothetical protein